MSPFNRNASNGQNSETRINPETRTNSEMSLEIRTNQGTLPSLNPAIISKIINHYKKREVQEEMILNASNREVAVKYAEKGFGKRPDILKYPQDILELAKQGATSFHASEELWQNPLSLKPEQRSYELDKLRIGWDLILDIDCHFFEYSRIAAKLVIDKLRDYGIESISIKFSGNKGFHIGVPFESFPERIEGRETRVLFPEAPRRIALYLKDAIKNKLRDQIMEFEKNDLDRIRERTGKNFSEIVRYEDESGRNINYDSFKRLLEKGKDIKPELDASSFLDIDTILISPRHLYRMPYSFNEKSWLISIPIPLEKLDGFRREDAAPENITIPKVRFLDREDVVRGEATSLIIQAFDFHARKAVEPWEAISKEVETGSEGSAEDVREKLEIPGALSQQTFPPCINNILNGLEDGRKRAVFILINFLTSIGWEYPAVENFILEWNKKNRGLLRENYVIGQLRYHKQKRKVLPPNCSNTMYYKDIGVCTPDALCQRIKNPVNYSILRFRDEQAREKYSSKSRRSKKRRQTTVV